LIKKAKTGIAVFDLHYPLHLRNLWNNILKVCKDIKPDYFVFGGDQLNMSSVSHWAESRGQKMTLEGKRLIKDYCGFNEEIMQPLMEVLPEYCIKIFMKGNHEEWVSQAIDKNPQGQFYWEIENNVELTGWKVIPYGQYWKVGKLHFIHGAFTNEFHAKKTVTVYEKDICYGHCHTIQIYAKTTPLEHDTRLGISCPCACKMNPEYMKNRPNAWVNGILLFETLPNGAFCHDIRMSNDKGQLVVRGKRYE